MNLSRLFAHLGTTDDILTFFNEAISEGDDLDTREELAGLLGVCSGMGADNDIYNQQVVKHLVKLMEDYAMSSDTYREIVNPPETDDLNGRTQDEEDRLVNPRGE